jgi:hypothetical protein
MTTKEKLQKIIDKNEILRKNKVQIEDISRFVPHAYVNGMKYDIYFYLYSSAESKSKELKKNKKYLTLKNVSINIVLQIHEMFEKVYDEIVSDDINSLL